MAGVKCDRKNEWGIQREKWCFSGAEQKSEFTCASGFLHVLLAGPLDMPHVLWLSGLVATHSCPLSHRLSNQSLFLWLLLRGVWPFCMWPFLDFSMTSSPSSSDSVSSLSLRSSWTMSCQEKIKESLHRDCFHCRVEGKRAIKSGTPYIPWQEFDNHSQDEPCPEDLQDLKHTH